jgi:hypothetical protein
MDLSKLRSRRNILALALVGAAARVVPVRAQLNAGCEYGITNGLVTIGGDNCDLPVPQQMIDARTNAGGNTSGLGTVSSQGTSATGTTTTSSPSSTSTTSPQAERQARLQKRRDKKRRKRGRKTDKKHTKDTRRGTRKQARRDAQEEADRLASLKRCSDFANQKQAIEYMAQYGDEEDFLDPDNDKSPCEDLKPVTCDQLRREEGADVAPAKVEEAVQSWLKRHGFSKSNNPLGLPVAGDVLCPAEETPPAAEITQAQFVHG